MEDIVDLLEAFFTSAVSLPGHRGKPPDLDRILIGDRWMEEKDGWLYPWRITSIEPLEGYPCGEPVKIS